jgi:hypothetical protein
MAMRYQNSTKKSNWKSEVPGAKQLAVHLATYLYRDKRFRQLQQAASGLPSMLAMPWKFFRTILFEMNIGGCLVR